MNTETIHEHELGVKHEHDAHHHHEKEEADRIVFGFWLYILSDCLLFATLFAMVAVLGMSKVGQVDPKSVFDLWFVLVETALLLVSSFTFGLVMLAIHENSVEKTRKWLIITALLGLAFILMELYEFNHLAHIGATPQSGGYWSSFWALIGTHGAHVTAGLIWLSLMLLHLKRDGLTHRNRVRLACLSLFWHFLDIVWICVFSFVYLIGSL